jgi:hypothetical protein
MAKSKAGNMDDVAQPGTSAPSASSRPVIITNRPILKDPMVVDVDTEAKEADEAEAPAGAPTRNSGKLAGTAPLLKSDKKTEKAADPAPEAQPEEDPDPAPEKVEVRTKTQAGSKTEPVPEANPPAEAAPEKTETEEIPEEQPEKQSTEVEEDAPETAEPGASAITEDEAKAQTEHDVAIAKLIESKKYFLPINSVEKRRSKRFITLGILLSLLLIIAWVDIALDAGLVQFNGIKPLTHFFSS